MRRVIRTILVLAFVLLVGCGDTSSGSGPSLGSGSSLGKELGRTSLPSGEVVRVLATTTPAFVCLLVNERQGCIGLLLEATFAEPEIVGMPLALAGVPLNLPVEHGWAVQIGLPRGLKGSLAVHDTHGRELLAVRCGDGRSLVVIDPGETRSATYQLIGSNGAVVATLG